MREVWALAINKLRRHRFRGITCYYFVGGVSGGGLFDGGSGVECCDGGADGGV